MWELVYCLIMTCGLPTRSRHKKVFSILAIQKGNLNVSFSLLVIYKHVHILIKDHAHIMDIAYKPFYNEAYLFRPLVHVVKTIFKHR